MGERIGPGGPPGLQSRCGARSRPGWVRFPHVPAIPLRLRRAFLVGALAAAAGTLAPPASSGQEPDPVPEDTAAARDTVAPEDAPPAGDTPAGVQAAAQDSVPPITPVGALVRSLVLPGWGQTAVGRPARGAVYFAAEAASLFMVFKTQAKLSAARRAEPPNEGLVESRAAQRENWIVLAAFWAFLSGLDAWVSTQFWDFEPEVTPPADGSAGLEATWRVSLPAP